MEFTEAELRFLHRDHAELRMPKLLTVEELMDLGCPEEIALRTVNSNLEKRVQQLGPKFQQRFKKADPLADRISAAKLF